jgi:subtilisin family serine protease
MVTLKPAPPPIWEALTVELERTYRLRRVFAWSMSTLGEQCIVFGTPRGHSAEQMVARMRSDPRLVLVQPVQRFTTLTSIGTPDLRQQRSLQALRLEQAHRWATGLGVRVAVVDTGVDVEHPDLRGRITKANNFVDAGGQTFNTDIHGTAIAGVIAANVNQKMGLVGVAPRSEIFALKACWQQPAGSRSAVCDSYTLAKAVDFAIAHGAQVLNFSLAGPPDPLLGRLISTALARGIVVVAADSPDGSRSFPASLPGVIGVAGSDDLQPGVRLPPSRLVRDTLAAPAVDILSTAPHGHYDFFTGSSLAAAQVSGIAALLLEHEPQLKPAELAALFHRTARPIVSAPGQPDRRVEQVDACAAVAAALKTGPCT